MMPVKPIRDPLRGEQIVAIDPALRLSVTEEWRRRLNLFTGRSLTHTALNAEQKNRAGRLALMGQALSSGVVSGLEVRLEKDETEEEVRYFFQVSAGMGLAASGEDVVVTAPLRSLLDDLPVYPAVDLGEDTTGVPTFGQILADESAVELPRAGFLVLQPIVGETFGDFDATDPCERDPENEAFEDQLLVDGFQLVFYRWPESLILPEPGAQWRNRLAWTVFRHELEHGVGSYLQEETPGVAVGLAGFDETMAPAFVDRYSVVRAGGKPRTRTTLGRRRDERYVWEARIQQFAEEIVELQEEGASLTEIAASFRHLPPFGLLPAEALDLDAMRDGGFFPAEYRLQALPAPTEQLDFAVRESAGLEAFDFTVPDRVELLVPVPQSVYEPRLLVEEQVAQEFYDTVGEMVAERDHRLGRRTDVRAKTKALGEAVNGTGNGPAYPADEDAQADESPAAGPFDPPEENYGTDLDEGGDRIATDFVELSTALSGNPAVSQELTEEREGATVDLLVEKGLDAFTDLLETKAKKANDKIDLGFLKIQTNIYKVRQLMLGTSAATRLATSPSLAEIAKGESALTTKEDLAKFIVKLEEGSSRDTGGTETGGTESGGAGSGGAEALSINPSGGAGLASLGTQFFTSGSSRSKGVLPLVGGIAFPVATEAFAGAGSKVVPTVTNREVKYQAPILGKVYNFRNITIAERLKDPPAGESKNSAVAIKYELLKSIIADSDLAFMTSDLEIPGFYEYADGKLQMETIDLGNGKTKSVPKEMTKSLGTITTSDLTDILKGMHDLDPSNGDESAFFSATVRTLDHVVAVMRLVEGRAEAYSKAVELCQDTLQKLIDHAEAADKQLEALGVQLAEARHDVAVARSLLAEEIARIDAINARREEILKEHVSFIVYRRPRLTDTLQEVPIRTLDPGLVEAPAPACLARQVEPPPELRAMIDLLREAPVNWFRHLPSLLDKLDRLEVIQGTIKSARFRAEQFLRVATPAPSKTGSRLREAVFNAFAAQQRVLSQRRSVTARTDAALLDRLSWKNSRDEAEKVVSLGDLIDVAHGRAPVAQQAARELENISHIAACLYTGFGEVLPVIRLRWVEQLSQFDEQAELQNLSRLPRWDEIDFLDRRSLQGLVDWLYKRFAARENEALAWVNDLVRVCLLLASHAPVGQIISGQVAEPTAVTSGGAVQMTVEPGRVRVGMNVLMYSGGNVVARGVVEDLVAGQATARVLKTFQPAITLVKQDRVEFSETRGRKVFAK